MKYPSASNVQAADGGDDLYAPPEGIPYSVEKERERKINLALERPEDYEDADDETDELLQQLNQSFAEKYRDCDSIADALSLQIIDAFHKDSLTNSTFPVRAMAKAYILKMLSAETTGFDQLEWFLERNAAVAEDFGFAPDNIPDRTTFSMQWWDRYRLGYRDHIRFTAAETAAKIRGYGFDIDDDVDGLINSFLPDDHPDGDEIPEERRIENESRDRVFNDVIDYEGTSNWEVEPRS